MRTYCAKRKVLKIVPFQRGLEIHVSKPDATWEFRQSNVEISVHSLTKVWTIFLNKLENFIFDASLNILQFRAFKIFLHC